MDGETHARVALPSAATTTTIVSGGQEFRIRHGDDMSRSTRSREFGVGRPKQKDRNAWTRLKIAPHGQDAKGTALTRGFRARIVEHYAHRQQLGSTLYGRFVDNRWWISKNPT